MANGVTYEFPEMRPDDRLRELILYIAAKCASDPKFNSTILNKILFCADFLSYAKKGKPITGAAYKALDKGPAPKRLVPVRRKMIDARELEIRRIPQFSFSRHQYVALRAAHIDDFFAPSDIALVDEIIEMLRGVTAAAVSDFSHRRIWKIARKSPHEQLIPYEAMLISDNRPTKSDAARAGELAAKYRWDVD